MTTSSSSPANAKTSAGSRLRPYLTTAQLISLAALASPIISLLFILFRLRASSDVAQQSVSQAKSTIQASCIAAEHAASVGASLPRYLAIGVNDQITDSVRATMEGVRIGLTLSLTATEAIIEFIIDMYRSTFLCLLELVIRGGLAVVIAAVSSVTTFVNNTLSSISSGIANDIASANNLIQGAVDAIKKIPLVGSSININVPQFTVPSASQLGNISIPTTFEDSLRTLNSSIPTLEDLREKLDNLISIPFQLVKKEINDTFIAATGNFTLTPLPVPQQATVTFCGDTLNSSFDDLAKDLLKVAEIGFFIVIGTMVLLFLAYAFVTWYSQRSLRNNIERIRLLWFGEGTATTDRLLAFDALISHPIWSRIVQFLTEKFRLSQEKYDALTWFGLYVFHPAPLACLLIGIFGILSVQLQLLIIHPLQAQYSREIANNVNDLTTTIATKLNDTMWQDSAAYAQSLNDKIGAVQHTINNDLFGWVNATIVPLNNTIATFYEEVQDTVNAVLGGTPFDAPAQEFIRCIIGSKVVGIEHALTFLQQNLQVNLPQVNTSVLVLNQANVNEVATPISAAAVGSSDDGSDGGVIGKIITAYINSLEKERITFLVFLGLWGLVVVIALFIIMWHFWFLPGLKRAGWKEPRWMGGPGWENDMVFKPDQDQEKYQMRNLRTSDVGPVSPIPSPLRKNTLAASTGTAVVVLNEKNMRQRRNGDDESTRVPSSFLPESEPQRPGIFARIGGLVSKRGKHSPKRDSGSSIIPMANAAQPPPMEEEQRDWLGKVTFWKRNGDDRLPPHHDQISSPDSGLDYDLPPPRFVAPAPRRGSNERMKPVLTVDVAKAATMTSSQPRVIVENPDYVSQASLRQTLSRKTTAESERNTRDYLAVPPRGQPKRVHEPKPPAWVVAMKNKQGLPAIPGESASRSSPPIQERNVPSSSSRAPDTRNPPRRPPGLPTEDRGRRPSASQGSTKAGPRDRQRREERRQARRSSVPPGAKRERESGQRRNKSMTRSSSMDDVDPFATPVSMTQPLPLPLEPVKLNAPVFIPAPAPAFIPRITVTNPAGSSNPFVTPFDDSYAVHPTGQEHSYNFSMPSRKQPGVI